MNSDFHNTMQSPGLTFAALHQLPPTRQVSYRAQADASSQMFTCVTGMLGGSPDRDGPVAPAIETLAVPSAYGMRSFYDEAHSSSPAFREHGYLTHISVRVGRQVSRVALSDVDWVETQGNYLALHIGSRTHLIRHPLFKFNDLLNPRDFIRIHRRVIVAIDRMVHMCPVTNGDALLYLVDGCELPVSRLRRKAVQERFRALGRPMSFKEFPASRRHGR